MNDHSESPCLATFEKISLVGIKTAWELERQIIELQRDNYQIRSVKQTSPDTFIVIRWKAQELDIHEKGYYIMNGMVPKQRTVPYSLFVVSIPILRETETAPDGSFVTIRLGGECAEAFKPGEQVYILHAGTDEILGLTEVTFTKTVSFGKLLKVDVCEFLYGLTGIDNQMDRDSARASLEQAYRAKIDKHTVLSVIGLKQIDDPVME